MAKKFITNWFALIECFLISYVLSAGISIIVLVMTGSELVHWVVKLLLAPVFVFLFTLRYYNGTHEKREARRLTLVWLPLFVLFDIITYIVIAGFSSKWFFLSSQPWVSIYFVFVFIAPLFVDFVRE